MGFLDDMKDRFGGTQGNNNDNYDNYDDGYVDERGHAESVRATPRKSSTSSRPMNRPASSSSSSKNLSDYYVDGVVPSQSPKPYTPKRYGADAEGTQTKAPSAAFSLVTPTRGPVFLMEPVGYDEIQTLMSYTREGRPVALNLTRTPSDQATRILDFSYGLVIGMKGSMETPRAGIYIVCPQNIKLTDGDYDKLRSADFIEG